MKIHKLKTRNEYKNYYDLCRAVKRGKMRFLKYRLLSLSLPSIAQSCVQTANITDSFANIPVHYDEQEHTYYVYLKLSSISTFRYDFVLV